MFRPENRKQSTATPVGSTSLEDIMHTEPRRNRVSDISLIRRGDRIEARRGDACYRGQVKDTAPGLGLLWIREDDQNRRRTLSVDDFIIHRTS